MREQDVLIIMTGFEMKHLQNQKMMGYAVIDEEQEILVAASFDLGYQDKMTNPIRRWVIYKTVKGFLAFEAKSDEEFKMFVDSKLKYATA